MFSLKWVLAVPLLDWIAVTFVEIEALFLRDVEILRGTLVESETPGMRDVQILGDALLDTEGVELRAVEKLGATIMEPAEALKVLLWLTAGQTRKISIELNVHMLQV